MVGRCVSRSLPSVGAPSIPAAAVFRVGWKKPGLRVSGFRTAWILLIAKHSLPRSSPRDFLSVGGLSGVLLGAQMPFRQACFVGIGRNFPPVAHRASSSLCPGWIRSQMCPSVLFRRSGAPNVHWDTGGGLEKVGKQRMCRPCDLQFCDMCPVLTVSLQF